MSDGLKEGALLLGLLERSKEDTAEGGEDRLGLNEETVVVLRIKDST